MPTTSNFGWTTPADTDLVKDGALAIRTLGNGIDTSMAQLKGGTTGQVLSKTSNTDMAFTWVTQDDANAIQNAIVDAKGDLIAATANDTPARLAVGNNGETLVADSSTSTGLRWQQFKSSNICLNSDFSIWQRGTSFTSNAIYTADRWYKTGNTSTTYTRQTTSDTTNLPFIQYAMRVQRNNGATSTTAMDLSQSLESAASIPFAGKTVTLSFYARRGANYSAASNALSATVYSGTGTDQNLQTSYTGALIPVSGTATLTTTWQRFSYSGTVASTATELAIYFYGVPSGTAGANDWYEVTGVQLEIGSVPTAFQTATGTLAGELAACQRYYYRLAISGSTYGYFLNSANSQTTITLGTFYFPVTMRVAPSFGSSAANTFMVYHGTTITAGTSITMEGGTSTNGCGIALSVASGLTAGDAANIRANNTSAHLEFSSEL